MPGDAVRRLPFLLAWKGAFVCAAEILQLRLPVPGSPFCMESSQPVGQSWHLNYGCSGNLYETTSYFAFFALFLVLWLGVAPAWGVSKEMVQLQTQVQQLQEQMTAMQRSFDERMGVMKNLVEQDTDAVNKVASALNALQTTLRNSSRTGGRRPTRSPGQIQALNDTMDEIKVRLAKVSKQLEDMQAAQQSLAAQQATAAGAAAGTGAGSASRRALQQRAARLQRRQERPGRCRNSRTTSSSIPIPIWPEIAISIWGRFSSGRATTSRRRRATTRFCRTFPAETRLRPRS